MAAMPHHGLWSQNLSAENNWLLRRIQGSVVCTPKISVASRLIERVLDADASEA